MFALKSAGQRILLEDRKFVKIKKEVKEKIKEEEEEGEKLSPYTKPAPPKDEKMYYLAYIILLLLILIAVIWAVKQVTPGNKATTVIGYRR